MNYKGVFGTELHPITFLICLFETVFFFYQIFYYLSRPQDKSRLYYLILLYLLIQYNIASGLMPDKDIAINLMAQNILMFTCGTLTTLYFPIYFYKVYDLKSMKFYAYRGSVFCLIIPFLLLFLVPYFITRDIEFCRRLFVLIPFFYGLSFFYALRKAIREKNRISLEPIQRSEMRWMFIGVLCWSSLAIVAFLKIYLDRVLGPIFNFDDASQIVEVVSINSGMLIMTTLFLKRTIKQSRLEYLQLQELNNTLQEKVTERTIELERMNEQRDITFANFIHETKTPVTLINNYLEEYVARHGETEELKIIRGSINKLGRDITNVFDIERYKKGLTLYDHNQITNISAITKSSLTLFKPYCNRKKIDLIQNINGNLFIKADPGAVVSIVNNIVENAIKYSGEDTQIEVLLYCDGGMVHLSVSDQGMGIDPELQQQIFKPYFQVNSTKKNIQGLGLGLPIVKNILESLGGKLSLSSSTTIERGTKIVIAFSQHKDVFPEISDASNSHSYPIVEERVGITELIQHEEGQSIMIVEDNILMSAYLSMRLNEYYNIIIALNGNDALAKIKESLPDLIISDIMMDEMDGFELAEILANETAYNHIPIIFLSARNGDSDKMKGLGLGAVDYIEKPFSIEQIKLKVHSILQQRDKQERKLFQDVYETVKQNRSNDKSKLEEAVPKTNVADNIRLYGLTKREKDISEQLMAGMSPKSIGEKFFISEKTVNTHIRNIYEKLGVSSRFEMISKLQGLS